MPAFALSIDARPVATVSCEGRDVMHLSVHGDMTAADFALAEISGGTYKSDSDQNHSIWLDEFKVKPGAPVEIAFLEFATDSHRGQAIEELYPDEASFEPNEVSVEDVVRKLKRQKRLRKRYRFHLSATNVSPIAAETRTDDYSFSFNVLWNWNHPRRARVALLSHSVDDIVQQTGGIRHAEFRIEPLETVTFRADA